MYKAAFNFWSILLIIVFTIFILIGIENIWYISIALLIASLILFIRCGFNINKELYTNWLSPSYIVLFGLIIVNFQNIFNVIFGVETLQYYLNSSRYNEYFPKVLYLSIISILSYLIGLLNFKINSRNIITNKKTEIQPTFPWLVLCFCSFIWFILTIDISAFVYGTGYAGSGAYDRVKEISAMPENMLTVFFTIYVSVVSVKISQESRRLTIWVFLRKFSWAFWTIFIAYIVLRAMSGDRGPVIYNILLIFYAFYFCFKPQIKFIAVVCCIIIGAVVVTIMGFARNEASKMAYGDRLSAAITALEEDDEKSIFPPTQELANSIRCNFIAVRDIDENYTDFKYGGYNIYTIATSIPGSSYIYAELFGIDPVEYSSSEYLTRSYIGLKYHYGLGSTAFSELYLDGGLVGIIIGFFLLGCLMRFVDYTIIFNRYPKLWILIGSLRIASISIYISRASFAFGISKILYCVIVYLIISSIIKLLPVNKKS